MKPGWKTSECWLAVGKLLAAALTTLGVASTADANTIAGALSTAVVAVISFVGATSTVIKYIEGRHSLKGLK